jgi:hypothetical protein
MKTLGMVLARIVTVILLLGGGYVAFDALKTKRKANKHKSKTAPFGDDHYESVKRTFPEHASDADTPQMIRERQEIALDKNS